VVGLIGVYLFWITYREKEIIWLNHLKDAVWWVKQRWKRGPS
jgi:hypothetical protein